MSNRVIEAGALGSVPLVDLFMKAREAEQPSVLELRRGQHRRSFHFRDGGLSSVDTSSSQESLPAMMVRRKKLQPAIATAIDDTAAIESLSPAEVIQRDKYLPLPELVQEMNLWATLLLVQSFAWHDGDYVVKYEDTDARAPSTRLDTKLPAALLRGVQKRMSVADIEAMMQPYRSFHPKLAARGPFALVTFDLDARELSFADSLDGRRSLSEVLAGSSLSSDAAYQLLFTLYRTGMLTLDDPDAQSLGGLADGDPFADDDPFAGIDEATDARQPYGGASVEVNLGGTSGSAWEDFVDGLDDIGGAPHPGNPLADGVGDSIDDSMDDSMDDTAGVTEELAATVHAQSPRPSSGLDMSEIRFNRSRSSESSAARSGTMHTAADVGRDEISGDYTERAVPQVVQGFATEVGTDPPVASTRLSGLFDGMPVTPPPPRAKIAAPRGGRRNDDWKADAAAPPATTRGADNAVGEDSASPAAGDDSDRPPTGGGVDLSPEAWVRMTSKDKERVRTLHRELVKMRKTNFYEWFGISHESPAGTIKKSYFKMAKLYHPDALLDEPAPYQKVAEALFSNFSTAYETLDDPERRDKYTRKHIHGEKDEDELALERVQQILAAENDFKNGLKLLNTGRLNEALRHFRKAVDGYDEEAEYVAYYGYTLFRARQGNGAEAAKGLELVKQATQLKPIAPKPWHLLGKIYLIKEDAENAKRNLRKSLKLNADNPECVRDYRKADDMSKGVSTETRGGKGGKASAGGGLKGLFGRFGKKKDAPKKDDLDFDWNDLGRKDD